MVNSFRIINQFMVIEVLCLLCCQKKQCFCASKILHSHASTEHEELTMVLTIVSSKKNHLTYNVLNPSLRGCSRFTIMCIKGTLLTEMGFVGGWIRRHFSDSKEGIISNQLMNYVHGLKYAVTFFRQVGGCW